MKSSRTDEEIGADRFGFYAATLISQEGANDVGGELR